MQVRQQSESARTSTTLAIMSFFKHLSLPVAGGATGAMMHAGIQVARELDASPIKDELKHFLSLGASISNTGITAYEFLNFIQGLIASGIFNQLSNKQKAAIVSLGVVSGLSAGVSAFYFGSEEHTKVATICSVAAELGFMAAKKIGTFWHHRNNRNTVELDESQGLIRGHVNPSSP